MFIGWWMFGSLIGMVLEMRVGGCKKRGLVFDGENEVIGWGFV